MRQVDYQSSLLSPRVAATVENELNPDESLVWSSTAKPGAFAKRAIPMFAFGIVFFGFAVFWTAISWSSTRGAASSGSNGMFSNIFPLFGIPFMLVGAGMLLSPIGAWIKGKRTVYMITDNRAVVLEGGLFGTRSILSYDREGLSTIERKQRANGSGDLIFEYVEVSKAHNDHASHPKPRGFLGINNVREVEMLLRETLLAD